jgi:EAL domain-containing protein (putative c-di-GMP-specific phosphodiesterase class I)
MVVEQLIDRELIEAHLQPIVDLATGRVVAHEALARGPAGSALERPDRLFAAAHDAGLVAELDTACVRAAFKAAREAAIKTVFVNVEPECFEGPPDDVPEDLNVVVEVTERGLTARPAELLLALERARAAGWAVAVDDLGTDWRSLALLPILRPCVVKLDRDVLAHSSTPEAARIVRAARVQVDTVGSRLLAEGIEDPSHEQRAIGFGAQLGQGWRYGRPLPSPLAVPATGELGLVAPARLYERATPFELVAASGVARAVATKAELLPLSIDIEMEGHAQRDPAVLLGTFQTAARFTPRTRERYARLATGAAFVAAFGVGLDPDPAPGVRGAALSDGEALAGEWVVIVVAPYTACALIARDLGDSGPDRERRFEYALVSDRALIVRAARSLMLRVAAEQPLAPRASFVATFTGSPERSAPAAGAVAVS